MTRLDTAKESTEEEMSDKLVMVQRRKSDFNVEVGPTVSRAPLLSCTSTTCHSFANNIIRLATDSMSSWRSLLSLRLLVCVGASLSVQRDGGVCCSLGHLLDRLPHQDSLVFAPPTFEPYASCFQW